MDTIFSWNSTKSRTLYTHINILLIVDMLNVYRHVTFVGIGLVVLADFEEYVDMFNKCLEIFENDVQLLAKHSITKK